MKFWCRFVKNGGIMTKRHKRNNIIIVACLLCMLAISSIFVGRTYAYFSAVQKVQGTATMGTLELNSLTNKDDTSISWNISNMVPSQEVSSTYKANINTNINYYTRVLFKAEITPKTGKTHVNGADCRDNVTDLASILNIVINDSAYKKSTSLTADNYMAFYKLAPSQSNSTQELFVTTISMADWVGEDKCDYFMGATIKISMQVQIIQANYLESESVGTTFTDVSELHTLWESVW